MAAFLAENFWWIFMLAVVGVVLLTVAACILAERKIAGWIQDRFGPNRVGPRGLLQPVADGLKLFFKEEIIPNHVEKALYLLAPVIIMIPPILSLAVIPWAGRLQLGGKLVRLQIADVDAGILYILAVGSLGVYGIVIGGWASNNKYSFFGAVRAAAQLLSYELPLGLTVLAMIVLTGTVKLDEILAEQAHLWWGVLPAWNVFLQPVTFVIFMTCILAESNRLPFDLPEAEQELVGGYHTEYSSMKFGMFFLAEYAHMIVASAVAVVLFFGGWHFWGLTGRPDSWPWVLARCGVFYGKVWFLIGVYMWLRWTLPRFRFDQLMRLAWRGLLPLTLLLLFVNAGWTCLFGGRDDAERWLWLLPVSNVAILLVGLVTAKLLTAPVAAENIRLGSRGTVRKLLDRGINGP